MKSISLPVLTVNQEIGEFFVGSIKAATLLEICDFDFRRMHYTGGYVDFLGIQRKLDEKRVSEIARYVNTVDAAFPTSIVLSVDEKCAEIREVGPDGLKILTVKEYVDLEMPELSIPLSESTTIIDGQHRLKGLEVAEKGNFEITVSIFIGADDATEASLFSIVNLAQTKVNKSLVYDLFALSKKPSPEKTCHEIVVALDKLPESPFYNKIKRLGVATEGRFGETISQATVVKGILPYITNDPLLDRDRGKRFGFWEPILEKELRKRIFYEFFRRREDEKILAVLLNYFGAVAERWPEAWSSSGLGIMLRRTNGFNALVRFLRPAYLSITTEPIVASKRDFRAIFDRIDLTDRDFNVQNFVPGTGGASKLYNELMARSGLPKA